MHLLTEQTIKIRCPAEHAYSYACNLERFGEWFPGVVAIESGNALEPSMPGKEYLETVSVPLRGQRKVRIVVKEAQLNRRLVTEGALSPLLPRMEIDVQSTDTGSCQVTWRMFSRSQSQLARLIVIPLARRIVAKRAVAGLARLKTTLEKRDHA